MDQPKPRIRLGDKLHLQAGRPNDKRTEFPYRTGLLASWRHRTQDGRDLIRLNSTAVTGISSFMALVAALNPPFKPLTLHRPWTIAAGSGATASVEVHRYVPGRNFDLFNDVSPIKLYAYEPDPKRTGDYYAIKRLYPVSNAKNATSKDKADYFAKLATELRVLAHPDLHGHPNIIYLFGVSYSPSQDQSSLAEPNFVLREGDCGDLFNFCRSPTLSSNLHTLVEVKMSLCFDIASGLEALHTHGVAHTDLKPQNILVRRRHGKTTKVTRTTNEREAAEVAIEALIGNSPFVAMLVDFSGSSIFSDSESDSMKRGMYTPLWCAPELYFDDQISKQTLIRADIYSAGLIFAFILMEGRDIFTTVVHHGMLHAEDTTLSQEEIKRVKMSDEVLKLAQGVVADFESCLFGLRADGQRIYISREIMYAPPHIVIFKAILATCLSADPSKRVSKASAILRPWQAALDLEFHIKYHLDYQQPALFRSYYRGLLGDKSYFKHDKKCVRKDGKCEAVPAAFASDREWVKSGVFNIQQSFSIFRASLTSGLKIEIFNDLKQQASDAKLIHQHSISSLSFASSYALPKTLFRKSAECAYQLGIAYLEGFGTPVSTNFARQWIGLAAQWGNEKAKAAYIPLLEATMDMSNQKGILLLQQMEIGSQDTAHQLAAEAIAMDGYPITAALLAKISPEQYATAVRKYRNARAAKIWKEFSEHTKLDESMFGDGPCKIMDYFKRFSIDYNLIVGNFWTILHYAAYSGNLESIQRLIQYWGGDVRILSLSGETALDVVIEAGHDHLVEFLLSEHEKLDPPFFAGSCPLQNCSFLPVASVSKFVNRVLRMKRAPAVDDRSAGTKRTALIHTLLIEAPIDPAAKDKAIKTLLRAGANPLITTPEPGTGSSLMFAVLQLRYDTVIEMLKSIQMHEHVTPLVDRRRARPEPANELARSFFYLMQKVSTSQRRLQGMEENSPIFRKLIALLTTDEVARELPYACKAKDHNPLTLACYYGNAEAARIIIENRTATRLPIQSYLNGECAMQALHVAIDCGFTEVLDVLFPLMMVRSDIANWNVLISAINHQHALVQRIYSFYEAKGKEKEVLKYRDPWGASALDIALEYGYLDLAKFLIEKGATYDEYRLKGDHSIDDGKQSTLASVIPHMNKIKLLMELKPAPRLVVTETGYNVFHILAADSQLIGVTVGSTEFDDVMKYFFSLDKSLINAKGGALGMTPFHIVSLHYSEIVGSFLLENGANINSTDNGGFTPLDYLEFHAKGDQVPSGQQLIINSSASEDKHRGHTVCDYALAGPVYWHLETKLLADLKARYKAWGAKTKLEMVAERLTARSAMGANAPKFRRSRGDDWIFNPSIAQRRPIDDLLSQFKRDWMSNEGNSTSAKAGSASAPTRKDGAE